jgi:hypothetical protein
VALTVALLGSSGLLLHSLLNLVRVPLGFQSEQTLTMAITLNPAHYPDPQSQTALFEQVLACVQAAPGTIAASWSNASPLDSYVITTGSRLTARPRRAKLVCWAFVTPLPGTLRPFASLW